MKLSAHANKQKHCLSVTRRSLVLGGTTAVLSGCAAGVVVGGAAVVGVAAHPEGGDLWHKILVATGIRQGGCVEIEQVREIARRDAVDLAEALGDELGDTDVATMTDGLARQYEAYLEGEGIIVRQVCSA